MTHLAWFQYLHIDHTKRQSPGEHLPVRQFRRGHRLVREGARNRVQRGTAENSASMSARSAIGGSQDLTTTQSRSSDAEK